MKLGKLGSSIRGLTQPLRKLGLENIASQLEQLAALFNEFKDDDHELVIKLAPNMRLASDGSNSNLYNVGQTLSVLIDLLKEAGASPTRLNAVKAISECLPISTVPNAALTDFCRAVREGLSVDLVSVYTTKLEDTLGSSDFDDVIIALKTDRRLKTQDINQITSRVVSKTPKSAPKAQSLRRIQDLHSNLIDSRRKLDSQRGKFAA